MTFSGCLYFVFAAVKMSHETGKQSPSGYSVCLSTQGYWVQVLLRVTAMISHMTPVVVGSRKWTRE